MGQMEPNYESDFEFVNEIKGGNIPNEYIPSVEKGLKTAMEKGRLIGAPIVGVKVTLQDGSYHPVDSSDTAFQAAGLGAFRDTYNKCNPVILEPIMKVVVEGPSEFQGGILSTINQRRGIILSATEDRAFTVVEAEVPLAEMFGYSTVLRSATQGKAEFTMEFAIYKKVPENIAEELKKTYQEQEKKK